MSVVTGAVTLDEANVIIEEPLRKGIIETIVRESSVLELLPFMSINGNALSYIQEVDTGEVGFREVNENYSHTNPRNTRKTETITRLGSMVEVDRFIELTQNIHDVRATATASKAKAIANQFTMSFFNGDASAEKAGFDGLNKRIVKERTVLAGKETLAELEPVDIHTLLDTVEGGADVLFMNKRTRRKVTSMFGGQQAWIQSGQDAYGRPIQYFGDVRIAVIDDRFIESDSIYGLKFGMEQGVVGIQAGGLQAVDNGLRGVTYQTLIEWYMSIIVGNPNGVARLVFTQAEVDLAPEQGAEDVVEEEEVL